MSIFAYYTDSFSDIVDNTNLVETHEENIIEAGSFSLGLVLVSHASYLCIPYLLKQPIFFIFGVFSHIQQLPGTDS